MRMALETVIRGRALRARDAGSSDAAGKKEQPRDQG